MPDLKKFPHFKSAIKETIALSKGDCLFIPAFYFYHMQGYNLASDSPHADQFDGHQEHKNKEVKPIQTAVSLVF
jgi:hypothetical protein